jgi:hypothetical protein
MVMSLNEEKLESPGRNPIVHLPWHARANKGVLLAIAL